MTSQTNIVKPGGKAQNPHRDYRELPLNVSVVWDLHD